MNLFYPPKKSLGQNFLVDQNIINKIIKIGNIEKNTIVLEIGPGYGNLTQAIIGLKPKKLLAIEKDKKLSMFLKTKFKRFKNINIINSDILDFIKKESFDSNIVVFGNLPYNISTQILASFALLIKWPPWYKTLILMFQKEVANRIISKPKLSNRLSVMSNWRLEIKKHFNISKNCFYPKPKIESSVLSFLPMKSKFTIQNPKNLEMVTRILFSNKRKMINKNFLKLFNGNKLVADKLELDLSKRPEELTNEMFYKITMEYEKLSN